MKRQMIGVIMTATCMLSHPLVVGAQDFVEPATGTRAMVRTELDFSARQICSNDAIINMPVLGQCPQGTVGIASCLQPYKIPMKINFSTSYPTSFECELDYQNMEPYGQVACDYSRCLVVKVPTDFDIFLDGVPVWR